MIKSPLRYPGGKSRAVKFIYQFIPKYREFRELFFGGGSIMLYTKQMRPKIEAAYQANDLNYKLYCFWNQLKLLGDPFVKELYLFKENIKDGRMLYEYLTQIPEATKTEFHKGLEFFLLNRITFSGTTESGGYSQQAFTKRFTKSSIDRVQAVRPLLHDITFTCDDYARWINEPGKNVFIFLDPPYHSAKKSSLYGTNGSLHRKFDHIRLEHHLKICPHNWLMTIDNCQYIRDLYRDFHIKDWNLQYGMNNVGGKNAAKGKELLISNQPFYEKVLK